MPLRVQFPTLTPLGTAASVTLQMSLMSLLDRFQPDDWRRTNGFSPEMDAAQRELFADGVKPEERIKVINGWMQKHQPCLFGRAAASQRAIHYCLIDENNIADGDDAVRGRIQASHLEWSRKSFEGRSSNFVLLVIS